MMDYSLFSSGTKLFGGVLRSGGVSTGVGTSGDLLNETGIDK